MSDPTPPTLAEALRSLPVPTLAPDFDDRVLAALRVPVPWWHRLWQPAQPLLLGASGSFVLTVLALHLTLSVPQTPPAFAPATLPNVAAAPKVPLPSVDALLDRPNLCAGSLVSARTAPLPPEAAPEPPLRRPEPRRRAEVRRCDTLLC